MAKLLPLSSRFTRLLGAFDVEDGKEVRLDLGDTDLYLASAADGTATADAEWEVLRVYLDPNGNPERIRTREGVAWDDRTLGW